MKFGVLQHILNPMTVYLLVLPGWRARIVWCRGRYDSQLVKRSSDQKL